MNPRSPETLSRIISAILNESSVNEVLVPQATIAVVTGVTILAASSGMGPFSCTVSIAGVTVASVAETSGFPDYIQSAASLIPFKVPVYPGEVIRAECLGDPGTVAHVTVWGFLVGSLWDDPFVSGT